MKRTSGILAHPTSFPSPYGIGDLGKGSTDFIDFLYQAKQKVWQVLPLGPTSFCDSPYQSFSTFAGNTLLISPDILKEDGYLIDSDLEYYHGENAHRIDYGEIIITKTKMYKKAFTKFKEKSLHKDVKFLKFCQDNAEWLNSYTLFVALKDYFIQERDGTFETPEYLTFRDTAKHVLTKDQINDYFYGAAWVTWPEPIRNSRANAVQNWNKKLSDEIDYYKFLQYQFFKQWASLKEYANKKGIQIIGDIPIFVAFDSSDVWSNTNLYYLDKKGYPTCVAGVPPDYFSETGQLWGNPLYNFPQHKKTGYSWWIKRIQSMLTVVDILRIDHFRGFAAYWSVPFGEDTAINGEWQKGPGKELFQEIKKVLGDLPIIAEDLGVITDEVEDLRDSLGFPGMKVLQFGFESLGSGDHMPHNFQTSNIVVYTGTHDNDTSIGWYNSLPENIKDYFRCYSNVSGDDVSWDIVRLAMASIADTCIIPIQDLLRLDSNHRMNLPGVPSGNWQFRIQDTSAYSNIAKQLEYLCNLFNR